jgi:hypothetical protein
MLRIDDPPRQRVADGVLRSARSLFDGHGHRHDAGEIGRRNIDAVLIEARIVVRRVLHRVEQVDPGPESVHFRLGIKLGHRQVAGFSRIASPDADELSDRGQSAPQDGDCENHLQERQTAANLLYAHGKTLPDYTINPPRLRSDRAERGPLHSTGWLQR